jgi:hypothetical protein
MTVFLVVRFDTTFVDVEAGFVELPATSFNGLFARSMLVLLRVTSLRPGRFEGGFLVSAIGSVMAFALEVAATG